MLANRTDEEIVAAFNAGEENAFAELVAKYTPSIYNFTARLTGRGNADDIVQEIFIKVWRSIEHFDPKKASLKTWVFTNAKNTATDFLRKKKHVSFSDMESRDEETSFIEKIPSEAVLPDEVLAKLEDEKTLNEAVEKLRPNYREVLVLHYQEEMTFDEIGRVLKKPLNTVKSEHYRAIMELRKML